MTQPGRNGWAKFEHDHHRESIAVLARGWAKSNLSGPEALKAPKF
jgi:hypothetical protein